MEWGTLFYPIFRQINMGLILFACLRLAHDFSNATFADRDSIGAVLALLDFPRVIANKTCSISVKRERIT
jgi:hypothetical protein